MILLLGANSYIGRAFARELRARGECFIPLSLDTLDYTRFELLFDYMRNVRPSFVINAGGEEECKDGEAVGLSPGEVFQLNTLLPQLVGRACAMTNTSWGHVSSACIYRGARMYEQGQLRIEPDLNTPRIRRLFRSHPENFVGFSEADDPNFTFRFPPCTYQAGTKALAEEWLRGRENTFIWRPGILFDESDDGSNLFTRLQETGKIFDHILAVSHLAEFTRCCLELRSRQAPFGTYNIVNPGGLTTRDIVHMMERNLRLPRPFEFWSNQTEFLLNSNRSGLPSCLVDSTKVMRTGLKLRPARAAIQAALKHWRPRSQPNPEPAADDPGILRLVRPG